MDCRQINRRKVQGAIQETSVSDMEGVSEQSYQGLGVYRFLRDTDREIQGVVRLGGSRTPSSQGSALQCHGASDCPVGRSADH